MQPWQEMPGWDEGGRMWKWFSECFGLQVTESQSHNGFKARACFSQVTVNQMGSSSTLCGLLLPLSSSLGLSFTALSTSPLERGWKAGGAGGLLCVSLLREQPAQRSPEVLCSIVRTRNGSQTHVPPATEAEGPSTWQPQPSRGNRAHQGTHGAVALATAPRNKRQAMN